MYLGTYISPRCAERQDSPRGPHRYRPPYSWHSVFIYPVSIYLSSVGGGGGGISLRILPRPENKNKKPRHVLSSSSPPCLPLPHGPASLHACLRIPHLLECDMWGRKQAQHEKGGGVLRTPPSAVPRKGSTYIVRIYIHYSGFPCMIHMQTDAAAFI